MDLDVIAARVNGKRVCHFCGVELVPEKNWLACHRTNLRYVCVKCNRRQYRDLRNNNRESYLINERRRALKSHPKRLQTPQFWTRQRIYSIILIEFGQRWLKSHNLTPWGLLPYTPRECWDHLKHTIPEGCTEADFISGKLEIDHIQERCSFDYTNPDDPSFLECWALSNLRLLPKRLHQARHNKGKH